MASDERRGARAEMLDMLLQKVREDRYPSTTMLDMIEELLTPEDVPRYTEELWRRIQSETYPSIPMMARLKNYT